MGNAHISGILVLLEDLAVGGSSANMAIFMMIEIMKMILIIIQSAKK